nr:ribonuclease H-like domain-containing protein [Tanacetum cinerariifolium]
MGDENSNRPRTLGDYSRPSHEGYRNTIKLPEEAKVSHLRSDTIWLVQNGCAFHELRAKVAWETIENLAQYEEEEWDDPIFLEKGNLDYIDATLKQELESGWLGEFVKQIKKKKIPFERMYLTMKPSVAGGERYFNPPGKVAREDGMVIVGPESCMFFINRVGAAGCVIPNDIPVRRRDFHYRRLSQGSLCTIHSQHLIRHTDDQRSIYQISLLEDMDQDSAHMMAVSKVLMLKPVMPITTADKEAQRRLEVKARRTLMIGILNEHQLKFNSIKDAKQMLEADEKRFDLDTMSMDDLFNNLKVYEPEVKGMSSSNSNTQNIYFLSSTYGSTNRVGNTAQAVNTANGVSTASTQVNAVFSKNIDNLCDAVICAFLASQPNSP